MNSILLFTNVAKIIGIIGIILSGLLIALASSPGIIIRRVFPIIISSIFMIFSPIIIKDICISESLAPETTKQQAVQSEIKDKDDSMIKNEREQQEITVEWYSDEDDSQDQAKVIVQIMGIVLATIIVLLVIYILREKNKNKLEFLKTCNLSDLSQEELEKYLKWVFCNRKSFSVFFAEAIFGDSGKINPEIYELEEKIEKELERRSSDNFRKIAEENIQCLEMEEMEF